LSQFLTKATLKLIPNTMSAPAPQKTVTFDKIVVIEFPMELGDNPACSIGVPVQIGWHAQDATTHNLEVFDVLREQKRRTRKELKLSSQRRTQILFQLGYSLEDIAVAALEVNDIRESRKECLRLQGWDRLVTVLETTGRVPVDVMKGVLGSTGYIIATTGYIVSSTGGRLVSTTSGILGSTGRTMKKMVQPKKNSPRARSA
jgi:hypothetical protein